jgi:hypothetical protein
LICLLGEVCRVTDQPHPRWLRVVVGWELCAIPLALAVDAVTTTPLALTLAGATVGPLALVAVGSLAGVVVRDAVDPIRLVPAFRWALTTTLLFGAALLATDLSGPLALAVFLASLLAYPLARRASTDGITERPDPVVEEQTVVEDVVREHE